MGENPKKRPSSALALDYTEQKILDALSQTSVIRDQAGVAKEIEAEENEDNSSVDDLDLGFLVPDD